MPPQQPAAEGDQTRALGALEQAVACAETGALGRAAVRVNRQDFEQLDPQQIRTLLDRVLMGPHPAEGLDSLLAAGVLDALLPEVKAMVGFSDAEWRHKDVWKHTKQVLEQSAARLAVRWAALLHDIGKVKTRTIEPNGEVRFIGHAEVGARMFDKLARRERLFVADQSLRAKIGFLVRHHLRASQYDGSWTDSAVRRFAREMGAHLEDLLSLSRADITTKRPQKRSHGLSMIDQLAARISFLAAEDAKVPPLPSGLGNEIMEAFELGPSRLIGNIKRELEAAVEAGEIEAHREGAYYVQFVASNRSRFGL